MIRRNKDLSSNASGIPSRSPIRTGSTFGKAERFIPKKSFSPDKFYDIPDSLNKRGAGIGYGQKVDLVLKETSEPAKYVIRSVFDQIVEGYRFGLRTEHQQVNKRDYSFHYRDRGLSQIQNGESPRKKQSSKSKYASPKKSRQENIRDKNRTKSTLHELENQPKLERKSALRLRYEYSQNYLIGSQRTSYIDFLAPTKGKVQARGQQRSPITGSKSIYLEEQKIKLKDRLQSHIGPGSYNAFSQFGPNLRT